MYYFQIHGAATNGYDKWHPKKILETGPTNLFNIIILIFKWKPMNLLRKPEAAFSSTQQPPVSLLTLLQTFPLAAFTLFHGSRSRPVLLTFWFHMQTEWLLPLVLDCFAPPCMAGKRPHSCKRMNAHSFYTLQTQQHTLAQTLLPALQEKTTNTDKKRLRQHFSNKVRSIEINCTIKLMPDMNE